MKSDTYTTVWAKCPYYCAEKSQEIICEGVKEYTRIHLSFATPIDKKRYMQNFCNQHENYDNCRLCEMLNLKYCMEETSGKV